MKSLSTKIILSALGLALLASSAFAQRARTSEYSHIPSYTTGGTGGVVAGEDVYHGAW